MRILFLECKKIFDLRLVLILIILTGIYYMGFMHVTMYPQGMQGLSSPFDGPVAAELIEKYGTKVKLADYGKLEKEVENRKKEYAELIKENEILKEAGLTTFDKVKKFNDDILEKESEEWTKKEQKIDAEIARLTFTEYDTSRLNFEIQMINYLMNEGKGYYFGASEKKAKKFVKDLYGESTKLYQKELYKRCIRDYISFLPDGIRFSFSEDLQCLVQLILISFLVLILPYQIRERLRGVLPLYATTHTGRGIFRKQFFAGLFSCMIVGILEVLLYVIMFFLKGMGPFLKCQLWSMMGQIFWMDAFSFGGYMFTAMALLLIFFGAGVVIFYQIGRMAVHYIAGIAFSVPVGLLLLFWGQNLFGNLFSITDNARVPAWELPVIFIWVVLMACLLIFRLLRDKKRDIL